MSDYPRPLDEVNEELDEKYGDTWSADVLTEGEAREWLAACYEHYENECERREVFGGHDTDPADWQYGKPFEIIRHVDYDDDEYDFTQKPLYIVMVEGDKFAAYPDELFYLMG